MENLFFMFAGIRRVHEDNSLFSPFIAQGNRLLVSPHMLPHSIFDGTVSLFYFQCITSSNGSTIGVQLRIQVKFSAKRTVFCDGSL